MKKSLIDYAHRFAPLEEEAPKPSRKWIARAGCLCIVALVALGFSYCLYA